MMMKGSTYFLVLAVAGVDALSMLRAPTIAASRCRLIIANERRPSRKNVYAHSLPKARGSKDVARLLSQRRPQNVKEYSIGISAYGRSRDYRGCDQCSLS